jgi:hypothetical protein
VGVRSRVGLQGAGDTDPTGGQSNARDNGGGTANDLRASTHDW